MKKIWAMTLALFLMVNVSLVALLPGVSAQTDNISETDISEEEIQTDNSFENISIDLNEEISGTDSLQKIENTIVSKTDIPEISENIVSSPTDTTSGSDIISNSDTISSSDAPMLFLSSNTAWDGKTSEPFAGGTGTADDPYLIANGAQLYYLSLMISSDSSADYVAKCYKLTDDIDLNDKRFTPLKTFKGTLDGDGHTISGINIVSTGSDYSGLIREINCYSTITIKALTLEGSISGESYTGGFVGKAYVSENKNFNLTNCINSCKIYGEKAAGGIVGYIESANGYININYCINKGKIIGSSSINPATYSGGLIGFTAFKSGYKSTRRSKITQCYNTNNVTGGTYTGGLIGRDSIVSEINQSANSGNIQSGKYGGGLIGYVDYVSITSYGSYGGANSTSYYASVLTDVYNSGSVSSELRAGGITSYCVKYTELKNAYNVGKVTAPEEYGDIATYKLKTTNVYYLKDNNPNAKTDVNMDGFSIPVANSAEDMVIPAGYAGFNFTDTWGWDESGDYPYPILKGMGVISNAYKTYTVTFADWNGTVLDTQNVQHSKSAVSPTDLPERKNYTFTGWDKDFSNITSDLTVTAQYEQTAFDVTVDPSENGDVEIADDNVDIGDDIIVYIAPDEGYRIDEITVDGETVDLSQLTYENGRFVLTVSGKKQDTEITATFEKLPDSSGCAIDMGSSFKTGETIRFEAKGVWGDYAVLLENDIRYIPSRWHHAEPSGDWNSDTSESFSYTDSFSQSKAGKYTLKVEFTKYVLKSGVWIASNDVVTLSKDYTVTASSSANTDNGEDVKTGDSPIDPIIIINIMLLCAAAIFYCVKDKVAAHR